MRHLRIIAWLLQELRRLYTLHSTATKTKERGTTVLAAAAVTLVNEETKAKL